MIAAKLVSDLKDIASFISFLARHFTQYLSTKVYLPFCWRIYYSIIYCRKRRQIALCG